MTRGKALLASLDQSERLRGIVRLAALGDDRGDDGLAALGDDRLPTGGEDAVAALVDALERGHPVRADPYTRLAAVRALAPHASDEEARRVLADVFVDVGTRQSALARLSRATAALALARAGTRESLIPLYAAIILGGGPATIARAALLAHPPNEPLAPLGKHVDAVSPAIIAFFGELGDPRLLGFLRERLRFEDDETVRAAALALARLGDGHASEPTKSWAASKEPADQLLAAEILLLLDAPKAAALLSKLLGQAKTRSAAFDLVERAPSPALVATLGAVIWAEVSVAERDRAVAILARTGGDEAAAALAKLLKEPALATRAAFGLATNRSRTAHVALERALNQATAGARRLIVRAGVVRALSLDERIEGLRSALEGLLGASTAVDRHLGAFGLIALGGADLDELLARQAPEVVLGAAAGALARGPSGLAALSPLIASAQAQGRLDGPRAAAGAPALLVSSGGVSPFVLAATAEHGGPVAPLAAFRLAALDPSALRPRVKRLLRSSDALVRAHVALGLGRSPEPDAVALLIDRYRFETDPAVRRAIVRALSLRSERRREATLLVARDLDPDPAVRALAASALLGRELAPRLPPAGDRVAWLTLRPSRAGAEDEVALRSLVVVRPDGLALSTVSAPDGVVLFPGLAPWGEARLRIGIGITEPPRADAPAAAGARGSASTVPAEVPSEVPASVFDRPEAEPAEPLAPEGDSLNPSPDGDGS